MKKKQLYVKRRYRKSAIAEIERIMKVIESDINPSDIFPTGHTYLAIPGSQNLYHAEWTFEERHLFHLYSLVARNYSLAEIVEEFSMFYFNWDRIREIGHKQFAKYQSKLLELKVQEKECIQKKNYSGARLFREIQNTMVPVNKSDYAQSLMKWLESTINMLMYGPERKKWDDWIEQEKQLSQGYEGAKIEIKSKKFRLAVVNRLLNYELSQTCKDTNKIIKILEYAKQESEGHIKLIDFFIRDVRDSILNGDITEAEWEELATELQESMRKEQAQINSGY